jgi:DNA (cytosine-5)-methyltransferase 1
MNHPTTEHRTKDLSEVDWRTFPATTLLWASPSCRWHAPAGGRRKPPAEVEQRRNDAGSIDRATAFAVIAAAEVHTYPVIIVENVPEFVDWSLYTWWLDGLRTLGYRITPLVLDAADFGHPQRRKRLYLLCTRELSVDVSMPPPHHVPASTILDDDPGRPVTRRLYVSEQIETIATPGVPHLVTYRRHAKARRADQHPLATVTAGGNHHGIATIIDGQAWHRMLNNRECARAQGFTDNYQFHGTTSQIKRQIGNAVPVGVAAWLGQQAAAALTAPGKAGER